MNPINVLSLFDGISCGQIALKRCGIEVNNYFSSEIDKNAIKVTQYNFPETVQLGDICGWRNWSIDWSSIDLLLGGSPCQGFSFAGKMLNFQDVRSKLFFEFVDILNHLKQQNKKIKFLLENVNMKEEYKNVISKELGVEPVFINSRIVSAQDRKRLYWSNFIILPLEDKNISVKSIIGNENLIGAMRGRRVLNGKRSDNDRKVPIEQYIECRNDDKSNCITTVSKDNVVVSTKERFYLAKTNREKWRYLLPEECEQLQTISVGYTDVGISKSARIKLVGNSWTVDVICHILTSMVTE